jgi:hypothetical protein
MIGAMLWAATAGFPNPLGWVASRVEGAVGGAAASGFGLVIGGLTTWVLGAVEWVVGAVFNFFLSATSPDVAASWFSGGHSPYATTLVERHAGYWRGAVGGLRARRHHSRSAWRRHRGMLRRVALELPLAVIGMVSLVGLTEVLIRLTDALSRGLLDQFHSDVARFTASVGGLGSLGGAAAGGFVVFLLALVSVMAGVVLLAELVVRSALIYIVVALAPLVFAAGLWPVLRGMGRKTVELLSGAHRVQVGGRRGPGCGGRGGDRHRGRRHCGRQHCGRRHGRPGCVRDPLRSGKRHLGGGGAAGRDRCLRGGRVLPASCCAPSSAHRGGGGGFRHPGRPGASRPAGRELLQTGGRALPAGCPRGWTTAGRPCLRCARWCRSGYCC